MQKFAPLIVGIIFIAVGCFLFYRNGELKRNCTKEATATVIEVKEQLNTDTDNIDYYYYPILEFSVDGKEVQVKMDGSSTPTYSVNDKVEILYNPNNTKEFLVKGDKTGNIFSIVFVCLGAIVSCIGIYSLIKKD